MTTCMYKIKTICVTNRKLVKNNFLEQINKLVRSPIDFIILREKDLSTDEYYTLADQVNNICIGKGKECIIHSFKDVAKKLNNHSIHLSINDIKELSQEEKKYFNQIGVSVHSTEDARLAESLGATYIIAGHIFQTDCKKNLSPRGLEFLKEVSQSVHIPVYAIGGISENNYLDCMKSGASGVCMMSTLMQCDNPE